jgi:CheY-like chemotaxis protein
VITLLDNELPWTVADAGQLQQVFLNIIVNAEAEMKKAHGRGRLTIRTEQAGNRIRISFADDGPGIAGENLERIFDPFFTTKEVGEGTGLGLSLAHGIVAEHNGALYAESEEGKGATFFVELPIVMEGEKKIERVEAVESAGKAVGGRILVVDDEPAILAFLKKVLGGEGYDVETVGNGREALGMIKEQRYSLIISDVKMPGLSGAELYDELGGIDPALQKRVIFITGDVIGPVTREFLERIRVLYFTKPFDITGLKKEVNRILDNRSQGYDSDQ